MSSKDQINRIKKGMKKEIDALNSMPPQKAKRQAQEALIEIGVITENGKVRKQYSGGFVNA
ncbi:MAG: hypothetical protein K5686_01685 [Lachnospiraceae bacterium]|nr:hypothetical protein [Lachnospiraceae bacterium]